jgi:LysM repeat protein
MRNLLRLTILLLVLAAAGIAAAQDQSYTVRPGDTITSIAAQFDVEAEALLIRNNLLDPNRIRAGQVLIIPTGAVTVPRTHVVGAGETLTSIAARYHTTVEALLTENDLPVGWNLVVGQVLTLPAMAGSATFARTYMLDTGDTLRIVAERFGVTWQNLAAYNQIANPNYVQAGTIIIIPPVDWTAPVVVLPPVAPPPPPPQPVTYIVQRGDMLSTIAARFGVSVQALAAVNHITDNRAIFPGDVLLIPVAGVPVPPAPRHAVGGRYTVRAGDTMFAIAAAFGVNIYQIAEANGILNLNSIYAGQNLVIPGR